MAGITQAQAEAKLTLWMDADDAVASSQTYSIGDRSLSRANSKEIKDNITFWNAEVKRLSSSGGLTVRGLRVV